MSATSSVPVSMTWPGLVFRLACLAVFLILIGATAVQADSQGGSFRIWRHGARALALGEAATLHAPGLESLFSQPASLVGLDGYAAGAALHKPVDGVDLTLSSFVLGWGSGHRSPLLHERTASSGKAVAVAFQHLGATLADDSGWGEWTAAGALAWSPERWFSLGLRGSLSGGGSEDGVDKGLATSLCIGARAVLLHPALELGFVVDDLHQRFSWDGGETRRRGSSQLLSLGAILPAELSAELLIRYRYEEPESWALGVEWRPWPEHLHLRGGLRRELSVEESWSPGCGFGVIHGGLRLDYGFRYQREEGPGSVHRVSLLWTGIGA